MLAHADADTGDETCDRESKECDSCGACAFMLAWSGPGRGSADDHVFSFANFSEVLRPSEMPRESGAQVPVNPFFQGHRREEHPLRCFISKAVPQGLPPPAIVLLVARSVLLQV